MPGIRAFVFVIAVASAAVAFRLGGVTLWTVYAAGLTVAASLAAFALWQDELLRDVMVPRGLDISMGAVGAAALYLVVVLGYNGLVAPAGELGGLLRRCSADGPRLPRLDPHGFTAVLEWVRTHTCRAYAQSAGLRGPTRGLLIVFIAALEEIAWRGGVQQVLSEKLGSTRGWIAASVLFGLAHIATGNPVIVLLGLLAGLVWGGMYRYRGRLAPSIFSHAVFSYFLFHVRPVVDLADFR